MEIIGVIDVRHGQAVHAVAGLRERYAPVDSAAGMPVRGDAAALARAYVERLGIGELYVADLDAIVDGRPQLDIVEKIAARGAPLWLDAAIASVGDARRGLAPGVRQVIVGLETLPSWSALGDIVNAIGGDRVAFSVDLRNRRPLGVLASGGPDQAPPVVAARAAGLGAATIIVIDLARVGGIIGPDVRMIDEIRNAAPGVRLAAGGGLRDAADLERLSAIGCDAALVASALHDGRLNAADVAAARAFGHRSVSR